MKFIHKILLIGALGASCYMLDTHTDLFKTNPHNVQTVLQNTNNDSTWMSKKYGSKNPEVEKQRKIGKEYAWLTSEKGSITDAFQLYVQDSLGEITKYFFKGIPSISNVHVKVGPTTNFRFKRWGHDEPIDEWNTYYQRSIDTTANGSRNMLSDEAIHLNDLLDSLDNTPLYN